MRSISLLAASMCIVFVSFCWITYAQGNGKDKDLAPNGKGHYTLDHPENGNGNNPDGQAKGGKPTPGNGISYHGGPVILGTTNAFTTSGTAPGAPTQARLRS